MLLNSHANGGSILQTNIGKMKILFCSFLIEIAILKFDWLRLLAGSFSF